MTDCIFCKIVKGELPCAKVWEDDEHLAFLDGSPNTKGMTLVITKDHFDSYAFTMPDDVYSDLMLASKNVAKLLEKGLDVRRVGMVMEGMGVDHIHIKLYPMHGLGEKWAPHESKERVFFDTYAGYLATHMGPPADREEMKKLAAEIRKKAGL